MTPLFSAHVRWSIQHVCHKFIRFYTFDPTRASNQLMMGEISVRWLFVGWLVVGWLQHVALWLSRGPLTVNVRKKTWHFPTLLVVVQKTRGPSLHWLVVVQKTRGPSLHWLVVAPNNTWPIPTRPAAKPKRSKG
jgi:hypothetical protein